MSRSTFFLLLGLIFVLAAALRLYNLDHNSLWMDEFFTLEHVTGFGYVHRSLPRNVMLDPPALTTHLDRAKPWWTVWRAAETDNHPPLHNLLTRIWLGIFGEGDYAMRSLCVVASLVALLLLAHTARLLNGPAPALWGALLMAIAVPQIHHAQDARAYPLLLAAAMGACAALVHIEKYGTSIPRLIALGVCLWAMPMLHYFAVGALLALFIYTVVRLRGNARRQTLAVFLLAGLVFLVLWGPSLWRQRMIPFSQNEWLYEGDDPGTWATFKRFGRLPAALLAMKFYVNFDSRGVDLAPVGLILFAMPFLMALMSRRGADQEGEAARQRGPDLLLWGLLAAGVTAVPFVLDLVRSTYHLLYIRYVVLAGPAVYMLLAAMLSHRRGPLHRLWHVLPASALLLCLLHLPAAYAENALGDMRLLPRALSAIAGPNDAIIIPSMSNDDWYGGYLYLIIDYYAHPLPAPIVHLQGKADGELLEELRRCRTLWVLHSPGMPPISDMLPGASSAGEPLGFGRLPFLVPMTLMTLSNPSATRPGASHEP